MLKAIAFIASHYRERITASTIAEAGGLSVRQLGDLFRLGGLTIMGYLTRLRIEVARALLAEENVRLEAVAERARLSPRS